MDYVCPVNEVEQQLKEAGEQLSLPASSTKDLLDLLDKTEQLLTFVGQAPSISMQGALVPSMGALIADELIKHSDVDVRVSVASCLCEVARITAPETPYKDEIMKEIFQLNVMAFGELSNLTGRSYYKAIHVLESVAKVKSCLLMLDLECDALILEMFEQFLSTIRTNHPHTVFSDMETIMTLVIEESDEIATELLSLLISHVRKENQNVSPVPWKLAEKVLRNCNDTLKSYSQAVMKLISSDPDDYAEVVTSLCQNAYGNELVATKSAMTDGIHKRHDNNSENGGSTKALMRSQLKKQKCSDTQRVAAVPQKIDRKTDTMSSKLDDGRLKGKELEASQTLRSAHESRSAKGRLKNKKNNLNQDTRPNLVQDSKEDLRRTKFQDKSSHSAGLSLKEKSEGMKGSKGKPEKGSTKTKGIAKGNIKTSASLYSVVIKQEDEVLSDSGGAEPLFRQMNDKTRTRSKPSSKKHVAEGSRCKDFKDASNVKQYGKELEGHRIKVYWPLDRTYYEGAVFSYDPLQKRHKVLYADGDEEILDLRHEKWEMLDDMSPDQEQVADQPSPTTTSVKHRKQKVKRKTESSLKQKQDDNSGSPKSQAPAHSSKTEPTKEHGIKCADSSSIDTLCNVDNQKDNPVRIPDIHCGPKSTEKPDMEGPNMIENVEQDDEPNLSGEQEEGRMPEENGTIAGKKRRRLVKIEG